MFRCVLEKKLYYVGITLIVRGKIHRISQTCIGGDVRVESPRLCI